MTSGDALGLLRRMGTAVLVPRPTPMVSRPKLMTAGPELLTVTAAMFDVMLPDVAVMLAFPFATPVTTPVVAFTVANAGPLDVYVKLPPLM